MEKITLLLKDPMYSVKSECSNEVSVNIKGMSMRYKVGLFLIIVLIGCTKFRQDEKVTAHSLDTSSNNILFTSQEIEAATQDVMKEVRMLHTFIDLHNALDTPDSSATVSTRTLANDLLRYDSYEDVRHTLLEYTVNTLSGALRYNRNMKNKHVAPELVQTYSMNLFGIDVTKAPVAHGNDKGFISSMSTIISCELYNTVITIEKDGIIIIEYSLDNINIFDADEDALLALDHPHSAPLAAFDSRRNIKRTYMGSCITKLQLLRNEQNDIYIRFVDCTWTDVVNNIP